MTADLESELRYLESQGSCRAAAGRIREHVAALVDDLSQAVHERDTHRDDSKALQVRLSLVANECDALRADLARERERARVLEAEFRHQREMLSYCDSEIVKLKAERDELKRFYADVAHEVGVCHEGDGHPCHPGPMDKVLEEVRLNREHAGLAFDERMARVEAEKERDEARERAAKWTDTARIASEAFAVTEAKAAAYDRLTARIRDIAKVLTAKCDLCDAPRTLVRYSGAVLVGEPNRWCEAHRPKPPLWVAERTDQPESVQMLRIALEQCALTSEATDPQAVGAPSDVRYAVAKITRKAAPPIDVSEDDDEKRQP